MKYFRIKCNPKSPFSNLFSANQIWGQMVWAISELYGDDSATSFVNEFKTKPPFLVSAMMPEGYLPKACIPPVLSSEELSEKQKKDNRELAKKNKKQSWIPISIIKKHQKNITCLYKERFDCKVDCRDINEVHVKLSKDKDNLDVDMKPMLYNTQFVRMNTPLVVFLRINREEERYKKLLETIFSYWEKRGLGGDRTVGRGFFEIKLEDLSETEKQLFEYNEGNTLMTLSRCFGNDLIPKYYQISVYSGIIQKTKTINQNINFNKYPTIGFQPGSTFLKGEGTLLDHVHLDSEIFAYGYLFPLCINIMEATSE